MDKNIPHSRSPFSNSSRSLTNKNQWFFRAAGTHLLYFHPAIKIAFRFDAGYSESEL